MRLICNRTQNDAIWELIALFLTNQIAGNTIDFKMNVISPVITSREIVELTGKQIVFIVLSYTRTHSTTEVQNAFKARFLNRDPPAPSTILENVRNTKTPRRV